MIGSFIRWYRGRGGIWDSLIARLSDTVVPADRAAAYRNQHHIWQSLSQLHKGGHDEAIRRTYANSESKADLQTIASAFLNMWGTRKATDAECDQLVETHNQCLADFARELEVLLKKKKKESTAAPSV